MRFITRPSEASLMQLQHQLDSENAQRRVGIRDIWSTLWPHYVAAEDGDVCVAVASLSHDNGSTIAELYKLYVAPTSRGNKIGEKLFEKTIDFLNKKGVTTLHIEVTPESYSYWASVLDGYDVTHYGGVKFSIQI